MTVVEGRAGDKDSANLEAVVIVGVIVALFFSIRSPLTLRFEGGKM